MIEFLEFRAWVDLRELAYAHGLTFHTRQTKAYGLARLRRQLLADGRLRRAYRRLPDAAKQVLDDLRKHGGQMPRWQFHGRYGDIRIWRPWRAGVPRRPLNVEPSTAEVLWHLGFIEIRRGRPDIVVMSQPVWHMLGAGAMRPRRRRTRKPPPVVTATTRDIVLQACDDEAALVVEYQGLADDVPVVRCIEPQMFFRRNRHDYVEAYCWRDGDIRTFRIDRILRVIGGDP